MNRKRVILAALLGVLLICLVYAFWATPRLKRAPPRVAGLEQRPVQKVHQGEERGQRQRIDFAYLESRPQEFAGAQRDIFQFGQRRIAPAAIGAPVVEHKISRPVVLPEVIPVEVMQRSLSQFTFLGFLEKGGEKTVFLSSGGTLFLVNQGERFGVQEEFLVEQIDDKFLKVRHAGRDNLIEVPLIEQQKLSAAVSAPVSASRGGAPVRPPTSPRAFRAQSRTVRSLAGQGDQDFLDDMQQEGQGLQDDPLQEEQLLQGDGNFWPAKQP